MKEHVLLEENPAVAAKSWRKRIMKCTQSDFLSGGKPLQHMMSRWRTAANADKIMETAARHGHEADPRSQLRPAIDPGKKNRTDNDGGQRL